MAKKVGDFFWERLHEWGVRRVFGYPGDGVNGLLAGLQRFGTDRIEFIQVRHEEMAAFMATAHSKFTGEVGVCLATSGPGATHLITGMYDAAADHVPLLAIAGQSARTAVGSHYQQEVDLVSAFKDVAGAFVQQAMVPGQMRHLVDRAMRTAMGERRVTALIIPNDLGDEPYEDPPHQHGSTHSGVGWNPPRIIPRDEDLRRAAAVLNEGSKVAILVGAGAAGAMAEVIQVADRLGAGAAKALLGKAVLPDDLPWVTGCIGLLGTRPSSDMMAECDTLLMIGSSFPWAEFLPKEGQARGVQVDIRPAMLSLRYPMEVPLCGDSAESLRALLPLLDQKTDTGWRDQIAGWNKDWRETLENRARAAADPINPQLPFQELSPRLPERVILTSDSGSCSNWFARNLQMRRGMMASLSGGLASMGAAVPYAFAAKMAHPDRPVIAMVGDGAMQMNNMAELITVAKYCQGWSNPTWICIVLNNQDLTEVTWEQRVMAGIPKFEDTQRIPDFPYHRFAELAGLRGIFVDDPARLPEALDQALASDRPVVLEIRTDPNVPPLPPHATAKQAASFAASLVGEPERGSVLKETARQVMSAVLPGGKT
ncbi:thiamine pyrophosphate-requiring protein [Roseomonas sp. SSH11]|uniref:Thiamine pyrophosphate-requiring protein n=1 Tax=Pararoseomonas baculiformis TaxID=2820812 RepID=A0ABS4A9P0_9PROT|nr:thiamine pyrophosphate-requiring protein [Pararoseomonas baculiformis]MBP0443721.1 thiamine pyrophosphate-requiring protein [Pararoseomonas baculiformis]